MAKFARNLIQKPSERIQGFFALTPLETVPFCPILFVIEFLTGLTSGLAPDIIELSLKAWLVGLEGKDSGWEMQVTSFCDLLQNGNPGTTSAQKYSEVVEFQKRRDDEKCKESKK